MIDLTQRDTDRISVCTNGHLICLGIKYLSYTNSSFCAQCGEDVIDCCPDCKKPIAETTFACSFMNTDWYMSRDNTINEKNIPKYCSYCRSPFPWVREKIKVRKDVLKDLKNYDTFKHENSLECIESIIHSKDIREKVLLTTNLLEFLMRDFLDKESYGAVLKKEFKKKFQLKIPKGSFIEEKDDKPDKEDWDFDYFEFLSRSLNSKRGKYYHLGKKKPNTKSTAVLEENELTFLINSGLSLCQYLASKINSR